MSRKPKIAAFSGSTREGSLNVKLLTAAAAAAEAAGAEVTLLDLRDYPLPLYDADLEASEGLPEAAARFKEQLAAHDGLIIASPEYNSSVTPLLLNTIDWATRPQGPGEVFGGKVAALLSASPGGFGGMRGLIPLRAMLGYIGMVVIPQEVSVPVAHEAFDEAGGLRNEGIGNRLAGAMAALVRFLD